MSGILDVCKTRKGLYATVDLYPESHKTGVCSGCRLFLPEDLTSANLCKGLIGIG